MIHQLIREKLNTVAKELSFSDTFFSVERPADMSHGDFSTNIALVNAKEKGVNPRDLAEKIVKEIEKISFSEISDIEIAGPGFINFFISKDYIQNSIQNNSDSFLMSPLSYKGQKILIEHSSPNLFKSFHIGHVMNNTIGESLVRLARYSGADVSVVSFPSDVSLGIGKAIWSFMDQGIEKLDTFETLSQKLNFLGSCYVEGTKVYEESEDIQKTVREITRKIYEKEESPEYSAYLIGRELNLTYFKNETKRLGSIFDDFIFESEAGEVGKKIVLANMPDVFEKSKGAIIFDGEKRGLHTRVFINHEGYPTYESKDIGLLSLKNARFSPDLSILVTDVQQKEYYQVVLEAVGEIDPILKKQTLHKTHGRMSFKGQRMSSRLGNVPLASEILETITDEVRSRMKDEYDKDTIEKLSICALKCTILKTLAGKNIDFDPEQSLSLEGDSGPYVQYAIVRMKSLIQKSSDYTPTKETPKEIMELERLCLQFPLMVEKSLSEWAPHHIVTYMFELSRSFSSWYGNTHILSEENQYLSYHIEIVQTVEKILSTCLHLLGAEEVEKM